MDGVIYQEELDEDLAEIERVLTGAIEEALRHLNAMRAQEGAALAADIRLGFGLCGTVWPKSRRGCPS